MLNQNKTPGELKYDKNHNCSTFCNTNNDSLPAISEQEQLLQLFEQEHKISIDNNNIPQTQRNHRCIIQSVYSDYQQCKSSHCQSVYADVLSVDNN